MDETEKTNEVPRESVLGRAEVTKETEARSTWNNEIEFLMSCIAMSIGFGNIWRFPFTAYENGGGVFLIPYIIVLFLVGKPFYYLEMILGQFSSSSSIKVWNVSPAFCGKLHDSNRLAAYIFLSSTMICIVVSSYRGLSS